MGSSVKRSPARYRDTTKMLIPLLEPLQEWAANSPPEPPPIILNKHCPTCQFQSLCRAKAEQEDSLSLLDSISTPHGLTLLTFGAN
jgi:predicted RecB family nuclease